MTVNKQISNKESESGKHYWLMLQLYSIYVSPILFFVIIKNLNLSFLKVYPLKDCWVKEIFISTEGKILYENIVCVISLVLIIFSIISLSILKYKGKNVSEELPKRIKEIEEWDYDYLPAIVTLMAMVTFEYNDLRGLLIFMFLLLFLFSIFAQTTTFYNSALYKVVGLKIYEANLENNDKCKIISFHKLVKGSTVYLKHIRGNVYYSL